MRRNGHSKPSQDRALLDERIERPISTPEIQEFLEGPQIARWMLRVKLPTGWEGFGFELTDARRWVVAAAPLSDERFTARIVLRLFSEEQFIWTKRSIRYYRGRGPGEPRPDDVQERMEGEIIKGVFRKKSRNEWGGESLLFEIGNGAKFWCDAVLVAPDRADLLWDYIPPPERTIILP